MTEVQYNTSAMLDLVLEGSGVETKLAGFDGSNDQQEQSECTS